MKDNDRTPSEELGGDKAQHGAGSAARQPYRVHLPGFILEEDIGLGDVVKRTTSRVGIKPCGGCERRAAVFNRWFVFSGRRKNSANP